MGFLVSMWSLLLITFISLIMNFSCYENFSDPDRSRYLYSDLLLPDWCYEKSFIISVTVLSLTICSLFVLLVT